VKTTKGFIFGGFTPCTVQSSNKWLRDDSLKSFLFTLKNPHNIPAHKFALKANQKGTAFYWIARHYLVWF
jgi:hypothetical protein